MPIRVGDLPTAPGPVPLHAAAAAEACGDDDDDESSGSEAGTTAPALTGSPINIGFMNTENRPAGSYPEIREATLRFGTSTRNSAV